MFCTNCGSSIPDGSKFCTECGASLASVTAPVEQPTEPQVTQPVDSAFNQQPTQMQQTPDEAFGQQPTQAQQAPDAAYDYTQPTQAQPAMPPQGYGYDQAPGGQPGAFGAPVPPGRQEPYGAAGQGYGAGQPQTGKKAPAVPIVIGIVAAVVVIGVIVAGMMTNWFGLAPASSGSSSAASSAASSEASSSEDTGSSEASSSAASSAASPVEAFTGTWKLTGGTALTSEAARTTGDNYLLYLDASGKAALDVDGDVVTGTWGADSEAKGSLLMNGNTFTLDLNGQELTVTNANKDTLVFTKKSSSTTGMPSGSTSSGGSSGSASSASSSTAAPSSNFVGQWKLVSMESDGQVLTEDDMKELESYGMTVELTLSANGTGSLSIYGEVSSGTWSQSSDTAGTFVIEEGPINMVLDGGKLTMVDGADKLVFTKM